MQTSFSRPYRTGLVIYVVVQALMKFKKMNGVQKDSFPGLPR